MYICAISNQKGGVGKTTTVQNLGVALANSKKKVLLVDLDAQGNLTDACGLTPHEQTTTIFQVMDGKADASKALLPVGDCLDLIPANIDLSGAELAFAGRMGRENLLVKALQQVAGYDYVLIDCPPSLGLLSVNALTAADGLLIPVQVEYHALAGLSLMQETMRAVQEHLNPRLSLLGLVLTFFDGRKRLNRDVVTALSEQWGDKVFTARIRDNVRLAEAPSSGKDIHSYSSGSYGAEDYRNLAQEFMGKVESFKLVKQ